MGSNPHMSSLPEWVDFVADEGIGFGILKGSDQIMILSSSEVGQSVLNELGVLKFKSALPDSHCWI